MTANNVISDLSLEFEYVTNVNLARLIKRQYESHIAILCDRVSREKVIQANKSDTLINIDMNTSAKSMKGILMLFEDPVLGAPTGCRDTEAYHNPKITKVKVTIEGLNNQLYSNGLRSYQIWDETRRLFASAPGNRRAPETAITEKQLYLADVELKPFLLSKFAQWLDFRGTDDGRLHGSGRKISGNQGDIRININKISDTAGSLNIYIYVINDAQVHIANGRYAGMEFGNDVSENSLTQP